MKSVLFKILTVILAVALVSCTGDDEAIVKKPKKLPTNPNKVLEKVSDNKIVVYQMMTRLFANTVTANAKYGTKEVNGVSKFNDINDTALKALKDLGITYVWYTGVLEHAIMADYTAYGIALDDADVIKGRAGSPYAIKDYYDVNPDLAVDVKNRIKEFEALVKRTHKNDLKVIIDFVPNHVARIYHSDAKPKGVKDIGETDDSTKAFDVNNNFYYVIGKSFVVPKGYDPLGPGEKFPTEDGLFDENPAKATGNDQFTPNPDMGTWFETVKLNYGVDIQNGRKTYFDPVPDTWVKMKDILIYWAQKDVDGFRCDMAEMVPVEFWGWAIPQVKAVKPSIIFIAEIYNPSIYKRYIEEGKFDYLYDKVGLYDAVKKMILPNNKGEDAEPITYAFNSVKLIHEHMLTFLENHDEMRSANKFFAKDPWNVIPGMLLSATFYAGPTMIYFGQEVGEPGNGIEGFGGEDGRTTIFDYWGVPEHQKWVNGGKFDGGALSEDQKKLRATYQKIFKLARDQQAIREGNLFDLYYTLKSGQSENFDDSKMYAYIRYSADQKLLFVYNFSHLSNTVATYIKLPQEAWDAMGLSAEKSYQATDIYGSGQTVKFVGTDTSDRNNEKAGVPVKLAPYSAYIFEIKEISPIKPAVESK